MILNKVFQVGIDVSQIDIYSRADENMMRILADRFEGYCYKSCFVRKILRIIRRSECVITQDSLDAFGKVSVQFEAEVEIFLRDEIVNGCKVASKNAHGIVICTRDNLIVGFMPHQIFNSIAEGQLLSVRIINCKYQIGQERVTAQARPYVFEQNPMFQITEPLVDEDIKYLQSAIQKAGEAKAAFDAVDKSLRDVFSQLIYAYNKPQPIPKGATPIDVTDLDAMRKLSNVYIIRDYAIDLTTPTAYVFKDDSAYPDLTTQTILQTPTIALNLIHDYINNLNMVSEMATIYDKETLLSHKNLLKIFKKLKN